MTASARRIAYLAVSADGLIADRNGQVGWLERFGGAADFGFDDFIAHIDALLMGRRTFDQITAFGGACCNPIAVRRSESTTVMRTKLVVMIKTLGATESTVISARS